MLRNRLAVLLAYISGILMLLSGSTGVASLTRLKDLLLSVTEIPLIKIIFFVMLLLSSLGGVLVIIGGIFIAKRKTRLGRILIWIGSGAGIVSLAIGVFTTLVNEGLNFNALFSLAPLAIILAILAQIFAKSEI